MCENNQRGKIAKCKNCGQNVKKEYRYHEKGMRSKPKWEPCAEKCNAQRMCKKEAQDRWVNHKHQCQNGKPCTKVRWSGAEPVEKT